MSQTYPLDLAHTALVPTVLSRVLAQIAHFLHAALTGRSRVLARASTFAKLTLSCLIGLAFVLMLPFAGIAALCWFAATASRGANN